MNTPLVACLKERIQTSEHSPDYWIGYLVCAVEQGLITADEYDQLSGLVRAYCTTRQAEVTIMLLQPFHGSRGHFTPGRTFKAIQAGESEEDGWIVTGPSHLAGMSVRRDCAMAVPAHHPIASHTGSWC